MISGLARGVNRKVKSLDKKAPVLACQDRR
jgi:hypothetical protein